MSESPNVGIVGATGAVGTELLRLFDERAFPARETRLFASPRSSGRELRVAGRTIAVEPTDAGRFDGLDIVFFSAGASVSREFAPLAAARGAVCVDNSSAFRMDDAVPLVVPEVNGDEIPRAGGIIANPNCSTILLVMALEPIRRLSPIARVVVSTYQAASGAGATAMQELLDQCEAVLAGRTIEPRVFPHPIAFNLFSHDSTIDATGYNQEERKMTLETQKILGDAGLRLTATCVRVPVLRAHCESVNIEFQPGTRPTVDELRGALDSFPGVRVVDDAVSNTFPMPCDSTGRDDILVGRLRYDATVSDGIALFLSGDQIRKGAALNAIQIAEAWMAKQAPALSVGAAS